MRKLLTGLVSGVALLGLAACGDTDDTTTQGIDQDPATQAPADPGTGAATPPPPADTGTGAGGTDLAQ